MLMTGSDATAELPPLVRDGDGIVREVAAATLSKVD
jgi:hypothetical protein